MIRKLPQNIINILAAGEVVERPYSVVKELIENSLDAGADKIEIEIKKGGKQLIKVTDNGTGIEKEDLPYTIEEHATSKIFSVEDLFSLQSFGFRGEALSTVSEVSKFTIQTKTKNSEIGWELKKVGKSVNIQPVSLNFSHGTSVFVEDLFFNLPVRRKFLKSEQTEFKYIQDLVLNYILLNFDKDFVLSHNDKKIYDYKKTSSIFERIFQVYPKTWQENLLSFEYNDNIFQVYGVMGKSILKFSQNMIKIFVNKRPIKDRIIQKAIMQAYNRWIEPGMYPFVILFLDIKPDLVDVNVHPRKEEVKFVDPGSVYNLIYKILVNKLEGNFQGALEKKSNYVDFSKIQKFSYKKSKNDEKQLDLNLDLDYKENFYENNQQGNLANDIKIIGQIFDSYILFQKGEDFYIMDQHAVAERVIFEKMRQEFDPQKVDLLSVPLTLELGPNFDETILEKLQEIGFDISKFGEKKLIVYVVPAVLTKYKLDPSLFLNVVLNGEVAEVDFKKMLDYVLATKSCKAAIKANHKLSFEEMKKLIEDGLKYIDGFFVCQHGRPSVVKFKKEDIDKLFDRM